MSEDEERALAFDAEHADLGWYISAPLPLYCEHGRFPRLIRRLVLGRCCDGA